MKVVEKWQAAREDSSQGELTYRMRGDYSRTHVEYGWWVDPNAWALGIGVVNDWRFGGRASFTVDVGPFAWGLSVVKGEEP